jgi:hypothetical protein
MAEPAKSIFIFPRPVLQSDGCVGATGEADSSEQMVAQLRPDFE